MSSSLSSEILSALKPEGRRVVITIGNPLRADDGVGPFIGEQVLDQDGLLVLNALMNPEDIVEDAIEYKPEKMIVIDAADFGGEPGEIRIIPLDRLQHYTVLSTHQFPVHVPLNIVKEETDATLVILGIQPASVEFGDPISEEVRQTAQLIIECLNNPGQFEL
jgi:hydrogenase maturation protease